MASPRDVVLKALSDLAPLHFAESWDNAGLIVDPGGRAEFLRAFVTIDLTEATFDEADELGVDLIVAYHPPIFAPLRRLRAGEPQERLVVRALRSGITVYSPHTALDAAPGGMNDWLAQALGPGESTPIVPHDSVAGAGAGRIVKLKETLSLDEAVARAKKYLGLSRVRVSRAGEQRVSSVAVCPGAGGSLFEKLGDVDLLITGEMRHHDVLSRKEKGTHVILTEHTNTERGYLPHLARRLSDACPGLEVTVSEVDADPLQTL